MVESPSTIEGDLAGALGMLTSGSGVDPLYDLLDEIATRHALSDAWLVFGSGAIGCTAGGPQVFRLGRRPALPDQVRALLQRAPGVYGEPHGLELPASAWIGAVCSAEFRASASAIGAAIDPVSGLSGRAVIDAAVDRAAAAGARYGWSSTLVLLTTTGDGTREARWRSLSAAVRQALRAGDEVGVVSFGVALAILGNAGSEAVRPFVARVRAALSAAGPEDVDLHAATARTPDESVDPAELKRLASERLAGAGVAVPSIDSGSTLEMELRLLPGVLCVSIAASVTVVTRSSSSSLHDDVVRAVRHRLPDAAVQLSTLDDAPRLQGDRLPKSAVQAPPSEVAAGGNGNGAGNGDRPDGAGPLAISATAPGDSARAASRIEAGRVSLLAATFDPGTGTSEVSIARGSARGTGRAPSGPLAGGAQATLNALDALGFEVPFYLVSAERAYGVPGEPVVVVLAPKRAGHDDTGAERLGIASAAADVEAASRATLGALNRHLAKSTANS